MCFSFIQSNWKEEELTHKKVIKLICFFKSNTVTKSKLVCVSPRTYKSPNSLNIVIRITKVWWLWFFMQLLQLFTQCLEMLPVGFSPNAFAHVPSPFAISTSGESDLSSQHPLLCHFAGRHPLVPGCCRWPPGVAGPGCSGRGWGVVLDKGDRGQLLAELLQHNHAL